jgi:phospholipase C
LLFIPGSPGSGHGCHSTLVNGQAGISVKFAMAGYYRIKATGPDGSVGWMTVDVGVNPNTAP